MLMAFAFRPHLVITLMPRLLSTIPRLARGLLDRAVGALLLHGRSIGFFAAAAACVFIAWSYATSNSQKSVPEQWSADVLSLGIEPIYPPTNDIQVGDIFAIVTFTQHRLPKYFSKRALLVGRHDARPFLAGHYKQRLKVNKELQLVDTVTPADRNAMEIDLPIVALPSIVEASAQAWSANFNGLFAGGGSRSNSLALSISNATTYGMPVIEAYGLLTEFCAKNRGRCDENVARTALTTLFGQEINSCKCPNNLNDCSSKDGAVYSVQLQMINRLYLSKDIAFQRSAHAALLAAGEKAGNAAAKLKEALKSARETATQGDTSEHVKAKQAQQAALDQFYTALTDMPDGGTRLTAGQSHGINGLFTLSTPVAVGYQAVSFAPENGMLCRCKTNGSARTCELT